MCNRSFITLVSMATGGPETPWRNTAKPSCTAAILHLIWHSRRLPIHGRSGGGGEWLVGGRGRGGCGGGGCGRVRARRPAHAAAQSAHLGERIGPLVHRVPPVGAHVSNPHDEPALAQTREHGLVRIHHPLVRPGLPRAGRGVDGKEGIR